MPAVVKGPEEGRAVTPEILLTIGLVAVVCGFAYIIVDRWRSKQAASPAPHGHPAHHAGHSLHNLRELEPLHARRNWMQLRLARAPVDLSKPFVTEADWRALRLVAEDDDYLDALGRLRLSYQFSHPMLLPQSLRRIMMKWHCDLREAVIELAKYDMLHES